MGPVRRDPPGGRLLGTGTLPPCNDTGRSEPTTGRGERLRVHAFPGVPTGVLIQSGGGLWMVKHAALPGQMRLYFKPVTCTSAGDFALAGQWLSVTPGTV